MTIHQLPEPCFVLDPSPWDEDEGEPHYETRAEAEAALTGLYENTDPDDRPELGKTQVRRLGAACWVADCDAPDGPDGTCPETLGDAEEGPSCIHFETVDELFDWMPGESWTRQAPDRAFCWFHSRTTPPVAAPSPAEQEKAGQLRLPGVLAP
jgi:hypothetical protein